MAILPRTSGCSILVLHMEFEDLVRLILGERVSEGVYRRAVPGSRRQEDRAAVVGLVGINHISARC